MYRAKVCECVFGHAIVFVHVYRIMHLPGVNEPDVGGGGGGGGGKNFFFFLHTFFFFYQNQPEIPAAGGVVF